MEQFNILARELTNSFEFAWNAISNTPISLLLILLAPALFTAVVFYHWLYSEKSSFKEWEKLKILLDLAENNQLLPSSRVLVVDDDPDFLNIAKNIFNTKGITVITAANGMDALNILNEDPFHHIDAVVTDLNMPHMEGKELFQRNNGLHPFLMVSGEEEKNLDSNVLSFCDAYMDKKKTQEEIVRATNSAINNWIEKGKKAA